MVFLFCLFFFPDYFWNRQISLLKEPSLFLSFLRFWGSLGPVPHHGRMVAQSSGHASSCTAQRGWAAEEQPMCKSILLLLPLDCTEDAIAQPLMPLKTMCNTARCLHLIQTDVLWLSYAWLWQSFLISDCVNIIDIFTTLGGSREYFPAGEVPSLQFFFPSSCTHCINSASY